MRGIEAAVFMDEEKTYFVELTDEERKVIASLRAHTVIQKDWYRTYLEDAEPEETEDEGFVVKVMRKHINTGFTEHFLVEFYYDLTVKEVRLVSWE